jgi:hypothetical protein
MKNKWFRWISFMCTGYFICRTLHLMLDGEWGFQVVVFAIVTVIDIICDVMYLTDEND